MRGLSPGDNIAQNRTVARHGRLDLKLHQALGGEGGSTRQPKHRNSRVEQGERRPASC
jgi:hypothetical protein